MHWALHPMASLHWLCLKAVSLSCLLSLDGVRDRWALSALGGVSLGPHVPLKLSLLACLSQGSLQPFFVKSTFSRETPPGWEHPGHPVVGEREPSELGMSLWWYVECTLYPQPTPPTSWFSDLTRSFPSSSSRMSLSSALFPAQSSPYLTTQISTQKSTSEGDPH